MPNAALLGVVWSSTGSRKGLGNGLELEGIHEGAEAISSGLPSPDLVLSLGSRPRVGSVPLGRLGHLRISSPQGCQTQRIYNPIPSSARGPSDHMLGAPLQILVARKDAHVYPACTILPSSHHIDMLPVTCQNQEVGH